MAASGEELMLRGLGTLNEVQARWYVAREPTARGRAGHLVSGETVRRRLRELGYSLRQNVKTKEGSTSSGRDRQFRYINRLVKGHLRHGEPVLSVDTKKKEREVNVFDYPHLGEGPASPYGAHNVGRNEGFVSVGMPRDTAEFAVEAIRRWWRSFGRRHYPKATALLICCTHPDWNYTIAPRRPSG